MRLTSIDIDNFRCYKHCHVDFDDRLTVIVGTNGAGKTSILEAARVAIGSFSAAMKVINRGCDSIQNDDVRNEWYELGSVIDVQPQYPSKITANGIINESDIDENDNGKENIDKEEIDKKNIQWSRAKCFKEGRCTLADAEEITNIANHYLARLKKGDKDLLLPIVAYYGTSRLWNLHRDTKKNFAKKNSRTDGYIDALDGTANDKLMLRWFYNMASTQFENEEPIPEYQAVRKAMESFFNQITGTKKSKVVYNRFEQGIDFVYGEDGHKVRIPLRLMSDGYRCSISLVADIAYRMAILNPQLFDKVIDETSGVVLIDEIDLHLHPSWQQKILGILQNIFQKVQFIVSTHAPSVLNSVKQENIRILTENGVETAPVEVYGKDVNGILKSIMESNSRPSEVLELFEKFHNDMDESNYADAESVLSEIAAKIGENDPELAAARVELDLEQNLQ